VIRSSHRIGGPRSLLVLAIAALIPALAGCEAGTNAPTQQWHQPTDGAGTEFNTIAIRNVFVLGAPIGQAIRVGQSAGVFLAMVNNGSPDRLVSITAPGTAKSVKLPGGTVSLGSQKAVFLTGPAPKVVLEDLSRPLSGGTTVKLVLTFQNAASVTLVVPVMPRAQYYSTFSPPPTPTPTPSPSLTTRRHHGATPTATPTPSATPTASPSPTATQ
jgi:copper(I)-binding protein